MENEKVWRIKYSVDFESRAFDSYEQAVSLLASRRDPEPALICIVGPSNIEVSKEIVWCDIKKYL